MQQKWDLSTMCVGILGMAFKGENDDTRSSLAFKLRRILQFCSREVVAADDFVTDDRLLPESELLSRADIIVVGAPHGRYRSLTLRQPVVDIWNLSGQGVLI